MSNDTELLRRFVDERAEGPFAELVRQHLNLVYSAALREMNGDGAMAEDVSQAVFTELAREANLEAEQLRAQLAKQASEGGTNPFTAPMLDFQKQDRARRLETDLSALMTRLHLTPEQSQAAHDILLRQAQVDYAAMEQQYTTGKIDKEEIARLKKEAGDPDTQIQALLTPDQKAAWPDYKQDVAARDARWMASTEMTRFQSALDLTSEQADRAFAALYQFLLDRRSGKVNSGAKDDVEDFMWQLDQETKALEPILTSAQLDSLRQSHAALAKTAKDFYSKIQGSRGSK